MRSFEAWYRSEHHRVLSGCVSISADLETAREATDEAFARALTAWPRVSEMEAPGAYVQTVALNLVRRYQRRQRLERLRLPLISQLVEPRQPAELSDLELWAAVQRLPRRQQTALILRYVHDLSEAGVAQAMGISRGAASAALVAARAKLRSTLSRNWVQEGSDV